jgi:transcription initiation factor TFIIIB Brf1 subunit/transcription initiation factor TFIIB
MDFNDRAVKQNFSAPSKTWVDTLCNVFSSGVLKSALEIDSKIRLLSIKGSSVDLIAVTALYISCRTNNTPRTLSEICKLFGEDICSKKAMRFHNEVAKLLGLGHNRNKAKKSENRYSSTSFKAPSGTGTLVPRWCRDLGISEFAVQQRCEEVARLLKARHQAMKPATLAAAGIYLVTQHEGVSVHDISRVTLVPPQTILTIISSTVDKPRQKRHHA